MKNKTNVSSPATPEVVQTPQERLAALQAEALKVQNEIAAIEVARINELAAKIDGLPKEFGVEKIEDVLNLIRQRQNNTLGSIETNRVRTVVSPETKAKAIARFRNGEQRSVIVSDLGIHGQTFQNWLSEAGLVNKRGERTIASVATAQANSAAPAASTGTAPIAGEVPAPTANAVVANAA